MKKFLLIGHAGFYNRGCEAIILTTLEMLRKGYPGSKFIISSFDYKNDRLKNLGLDVEYIKHKLSIKRKSFKWVFQQINRVLYKEYRKNYWKVPYRPISDVLDEVDIVLSVGGDNYTMDYGHPHYFLGLNKLVKEAGKKMVIWSASIGPFPDYKNLMSIIEGLKSIALITVRDSESINYLASIGIKDNVRRVADPAFLLPPLETNICSEYFANPKGVLGFNISPLLKRYRDKSWGENIIQEIVVFLKSIITEYGLNVLLIPHVTGSKVSENDFLYMMDIYEQLKNTNCIDIVPDINTAAQIKYVISKCKYFIGARTHSTIAALSTGVPTISLGYSMKAQGINQDLFGSLDYMIKLENLSAESLSERFSTLVDNENKIRIDLSSKIFFLKEQARDNIKYLKEVLTQ
ncbi:MAG: polysaccharide pyruvyl transferase family protein [Candidatus Omnitrophota bacterium]